MVVCVFCSQPFPSGFLLLQTSDAQTLFIRIDDNFDRNMWNPLLELLFFEQASGIVASYLVESTWPRSHFVVTLLLTYFVTRKRCLPLHDDALDTTAYEVPYVLVAPLPSLRGRVWRVATTLCLTFLYPLLLVHFSLVYVRNHM